MKTLLLLFVLTLTAASAQHPDDYRWDDRFSKPGISNPEYNGAPIRGAIALAANNDYVVVGGRFTVPGNNIALWNKRTLSWEQAGSGVWKNPTQYDYPEVQSLTAVGDSIFVSGRFTTAGGLPAEGYAIFNTRTKVWSTDTLFSGSVSSISTLGNELIFSGGFTIKGTSIRNCARWSNGQWSAFQSDTTMVPGVICEYKGTLYSNVLYSVPTKYTAISRWAGTTWVPIIKKMYSLAYTYYTLRATRDYLYLLGGLDSMELASGKMVKGGSLMRFDGTVWKSIIDSNFMNNVRSIAFDGEDIFIGGEFSSVQGYTANRIARWDNASSRWSGLGSGISGDDYGAKINAILVSDKQVYVAGQFATAGGQNVNNFARYDLTTFNWYPFGDAKTLAPSVIGIGNVFVFNDRGKLLVTGDYDYAGDKRLNSVGYWTGKDWENAGTGIIGGAGYTYTGLTRIFSGPTGITNFARVGGTMYLGGTFEQLGSYNCNNLTMYDNGNTECVGGGLTQSHMGAGSGYFVPASVTALISIGQNLYVGGDFLQAGSLKVRSLAQWDGKAWSSMGGGVLNSASDRYIFAEDSSHHLIVAGAFSKIGGTVANGLASWNGVEWKALGYNGQDSANAYINALCVTPSGEILVAGFLSSASYKGPGSLARVSGDSYETITEVFLKGKNNGSISVMACKGDLLYVAGGFDHIGDIAANNVAVYNLKTKQWSPLGSGFVKTLTQDTVTYNRVSVQTIAFIGDTVYFGGAFTYAGGKPSFNIAAWLPPKTNGVEYAGEVTGSNPSLTAAPNPASNTLQFQAQLLHTERCRLVLIDALGRVVQSVADDVLPAGAYTITADVSSLPSGVYFARMEFGASMRSTQVSIIH